MENDVMSIEGGLLEYKMNERLGGDSAPLPYGRKVRFLNINGNEYQREKANQHFSESDILTINEIFVDKFSSEVEFVEVPDVRFNTVMFADVK